MEYVRATRITRTKRLGVRKRGAAKVEKNLIDRRMETFCAGLYRLAIREAVACKQEAYRLIGRMAFAGLAASSDITAYAFVAARCVEVSHLLSNKPENTNGVQITTSAIM